MSKLKKIKQGHATANGVFESQRKLRGSMNKAQMANMSLSVISAEQDTEEKKE